jgi:hypothetical protein
VLGSVTASGTGTGQYYATVTGLTCGTHYYFRPWATNSTGTYYATSLIGTGCTTGAEQFTSYTLYSSVSDDCQEIFTTSAQLAYDACYLLNNPNPNCGQISRTGSSWKINNSTGTLIVGDIVYSSFDYCTKMIGSSNYRIYTVGNQEYIIYIANGVIQSITSCP